MFCLCTIGINEVNFEGYLPRRGGENLFLKYQSFQQTSAKFSVFNRYCNRNNSCLLHILNRIIVTRVKSGARDMLAKVKKIVVFKKSMSNLI